MVMDTILVSQGAALDSSLVTEGTSSAQKNKYNTSGNDSSDSQPSSDTNTTSKVHHDTFDNVFDEKCLFLDIQKVFFKVQIESAMSVSQNHESENENLAHNSSLETKKHCLRSTITKLSNHFETLIVQIENQCAQFQKEFSKTETYKELFESVQSSGCDSNIKELEAILAQQTKDFRDAKIKFSKKTDKFETYFKKLESSNAILERQLARKMDDFKAEKERFLKQIASLESKLASQDLLSNKKEYNELRVSYNALKVKFDTFNRDKGNSHVSKPKVSVTKKVYTGESSKAFSHKGSQFTTYSLPSDRKFSKKP
nr:hypothetical protein [Tanacetum cinerariifolium]